MLWDSEHRPGGGGGALAAQQGLQPLARGPEELGQVRVCTCAFGEVLDVGGQVCRRAGAKAGAAISGPRPRGNQWPPPGQGPFRRRGPRAMSEEGAYLFLKWLLDPLFPVGPPPPATGALLWMSVHIRTRVLRQKGPGASRHRLQLPSSQLPSPAAHGGCAVQNVLECPGPTAHPGEGTQSCYAHHPS